jgi:neurotransmitter:Na+ symporter, NSS family
MSSVPREQWSSRIGFILAAVGSAVGLGNMWRFSYLTAENGGAAFVILYVVMVLLIGLPVLLAELTIGRGAQKSPIEALAHYGGRGWRPLGYLFVLSGFMILAFYGVIAGWVIRYSWLGITAGFAGMGSSGEVFGRVSTGGGAVALQVLFMAATIAIVLRGISGGIEKVSIALMPVLFLIVIGIAAYASTLEGAGAGYSFYLQTDFAEVLSLDVLTAAAGQAFFSMSLGMGAMLTYASYLSRSADLPRESISIAGVDFLVAFIAGLMVFPLIFALGLSDEVGGSTVGALFITLPQAFAGMGAAGQAVGLLFFFALFVGALTSAISLLEVVASSAIDTLGWSRTRATVIAGVGITLAGIPAALSLDVLGLMDQIAGNVFLVLGALLISIFTGWVHPDPIGAVREGAAPARWFPLWRGFLRYVVPVFLLLLLFTSVRGTVETIQGMLAAEETGPPTIE